MIKNALIVRALFLLITMLASRAGAFPEMVRFGYVNCITCHVSPSGGGVLTGYGRKVSGEALNTWFQEGETGLAHGFLKTPEWLNVGGDIRTVEIYRDTPQVQAARFLNMQEDAEAAASFGPYTIDLSTGFYMGEFAARRFYAMFRATDEWTFRIGKFQHAYGLMDPEHTNPIHRALGWDEGSESYNLEASYSGEFINFYLTADFGPLDSKLIPDNMKEKGASLRIGIPFWDTYEAGISYFHGQSPSFDRDVAGFWAALGLSERFFLLSEIDYENIDGSASTGFPNQSNIVTWNRLDYEFIKGLHAYLTYSQSQLRQNVKYSPSRAEGIGLQWFPRPHFEWNFLWQFQTVPAFGSATLNYVTSMLHYYF